MTEVISKQLFLPNTNAGLVYDIDTCAAFSYTLTDLLQIQTSSGTVTASVQINGTPVTGLTGIAVSAVPTTATATAANVVSVGDRVQIVFSSSVAVTNLNVTIAATRGNTSLDGVLQFSAIDCVGGYVSGNYYANHKFTTTTSGGGTNLWVMVPMLWADDFTFSEWGVYCSSAIASNFKKLQLFDSDADGMPGNLLYESPDLNFSSTGYKFETLGSNITLTGGATYWSGIRMNSIAQYYAQPASDNKCLGWSSATGTTPYYAVARTLAYATATPSTYNFVAADLFGTGTVAPSIRFKAA